MPKIVLKPNSAEYADIEQKNKKQTCDMPGCHCIGEFKAPKHRNLNDYYYFCLEHVKEYNRAWNFFAGMSDADVQEHMQQAFYGNRPTWNFAEHGAAEDILKKKAWQTYTGGEGYEQDKRRDTFEQQQGPIKQNSPEMEAMAIMGLEPPIDLAGIKKRYKELAKKHHPDLNGGCKKAEELLKQINMAYTILKMAFAEYEKIKDR